MTDKRTLETITGAQVFFFCWPNEQISPFSSKHPRCRFLCIGLGAKAAVSAVSLSLLQLWDVFVNSGGRSCAATRYRGLAGGIKTKF